MLMLSCRRIWVSSLLRIPHLQQIWPWSDMAISMRWLIPLEALVRSLPHGHSCGRWWRHLVLVCGFSEASLGDSATGGEQGQAEHRSRQPRLGCHSSREKKSIMAWVSSEKAQRSVTFPPSTWAISAIR
jgi:hypothetical protein